MANAAERNVKITFLGVDKVSDVASSVSKSMLGIEDVAGQVANPLAGIADDILAANAAFGALAAGGIAYAVKEASTFQTSFNEISTLLKGVAEEDLETLKKSMQTYAADSTQSLEQINEAVYQAISLGVDYTDSLGFVRTAEQLAVAGKADLAATVDVLKSTLNSYNATTEDAAKYSDVFFTTVQLGKTTIPELAASLSQVTGVASGGKVPIETLSAAIATLTASGAPTSQAITQIQAAISGIIKPSSEAATLAAELGIGFDASSLATKGFEQVLWDAYEATGGSVDQMSKLFGSTEALNAVLKLTGEGTQKFTETLRAMQEAAGATSEAYAKMAENFEKQLQKVENNFRLLFRAFGTEVLDEVGGVADGITDILQALTSEVDRGTFDPIIKALNATFADARQLLEGVADALPKAFENVDFSEMIDAMQRLTDEVTGMFDGLDLTKPEDLGDAIQTVVDTIKAATNVTTGMVEQFSKLFNLITQSIEEFGKLDDDQQIKVGNMLAAAKVFSDLGAEVLVLMNTIGDNAEMIGGAVQLAFGVAGLAFEGLRVVLLLVQRYIGDVVLAWGHVVDAVTFGATDIGDSMKDLGRGLIDGAKRDLLDLGDSAERSYDQARMGMARFMVALTDTTDQAAVLHGQLDEIPGKKKFEVDNSSLEAFMASLVELGYNISELPAETIIEAYLAAGGVYEAVDEIQARLDRISREEAIITAKLEDATGVERKALERNLEILTRERAALVGAEADEAAIERTAKELEEKIPKDKVTEYTVEEDGSISLVSEKLNEQLPREKKTEVKVDLTAIEVAKIEAMAETIQSHLQFEAQINVAAIEAGAKQLESTLDAIASNFQAASDVINASLGAYADIVNAGGSYYDLSPVLKLMQEEQALKRQMFAEQQLMNQKQREYMDAIIQSIARGDGMIKIDTTGLQPHVEQVILSMVEMLQARVSDSMAGGPLLTAAALG